MDEQLKECEGIKMDDRKVDKISERVARSVTAQGGDSLIDFVIPEDDLVKTHRELDEETAEVMADTYRQLKKDLELSKDQQEAINRLRNVIERGMEGAMARNQIFKAADAIGLKLPSSAF